MIIQISDNVYEEVRQSMINDKKAKIAQYMLMQGLETRLSKGDILIIILYVAVGVYFYWMGWNGARFLQAENSIIAGAILAAFVLVFLIMTLISIHRTKMRPTQDKIDETKLELVILEELTTNTDDIVKYLKRNHWDLYQSIETATYIKQNPDAVREMYYVKRQESGASIVFKYIRDEILTKGIINLTSEDVVPDIEEDTLMIRDGLVVYRRKQK